jgi:hypothetical protein
VRAHTHTHTHIHIHTYITLKEIMPTYNKVISPNVIDISVLLYIHGVRARTRIKTIQQYILKYIKNISHYFNYERKNCL